VHTARTSQRSTKDGRGARWKSDERSTWESLCSPSTPRSQGTYFCLTVYGCSCVSWFKKHSAPSFHELCSNFILYKNNLNMSSFWCKGVGGIGISLYYRLLSIQEYVLKSPRNIATTFGSKLRCLKKQTPSVSWVLLSIHTRHTTTLINFFCVCRTPFC